MEWDEVLFQYVSNPIVLAADHNQNPSIDLFAKRLFCCEIVLLQLLVAILLGPLEKYLLRPFHITFCTVKYSDYQSFFHCKLPPELSLPLDQLVLVWSVDCQKLQLPVVWLDFVETS